MQVNFTGTKNIGYKCDFIYPTYEHDGQLCYKQDEYADMNIINLQLTDDYDGKDLTNYKKAVAKSDAEKKSHPILPNFINFAVLKGELPADKDTYFFLNGSRLEVNDQNMSIFSFLAKTLKGLTEKPLEKFVVNSDYLFGDEVGKSISLGQDLEDDFDDHFDYLEAVSDMHRNEHAQNGAAKMLGLLENKIYEYLGI